ncbi:hypothetical protein GAH_00581 [Geoglobus ahangari]|uniref:Uncharacterized protein n=2 Tax=Geoglobus ahangari TaxID=113653 RepID=A0A0F7IER4_9EURY|nr:hypothetical protein GAH_00581 [Geoglobus ahangari]
MCSMRSVEFVAVLTAMLVPFVALKTSDLSTYLYWTAVVSAYLAHIAYRRWEVE